MRFKNGYKLYDGKHKQGTNGAEEIAIENEYPTVEGIKEAAESLQIIRYLGQII
jgi:hypothetical protein